MIRAALIAVLIAAAAQAAFAQGMLGVFQRPLSSGACSNSLDFSQTCNSMYVAFPGV